MKNIPMADRRLSRSIVLVLSTALVAGYRSFQRSRQPVAEPSRAARRAESPRH